MNKKKAIAAFFFYGNICSISALDGILCVMCIKSTNDLKNVD
jgi:hypothetical protein